MKKTAKKNSSIKTLEKQIKNDEVYVHTAIAVMCGKGYKKMTVTKSAFKRNIMSLESSRYTLKRVAIPENAKCERFFTPQDDGLSQSWENEVCWCNPPYGKDVVKWCKKALAESKRGATTVLLIPCKTNTNWWHDFVIPYAEIRFLRGRVAFVYPNGEQTTQALPWPLAFVIYRPNVD